MKISYLVLLISALFSACSILPQQEDNFVNLTPHEEDSLRLDKLYAKRYKIDKAIFDLINTAALEKNTDMKSEIELFEKSLGYIPNLAVRHYKYALGDKTQLDWLLNEFDSNGIGRDSLILIIFGYLDEWDETVKRFKAQAKVADGAASTVLGDALAIRKKIYGKDLTKAVYGR